MRLIEAALARYLGAMLAHQDRDLTQDVAGQRESRAGFLLGRDAGQLPKTVVPINYAIELKLGAESLTLCGVEMIDIEMREPIARASMVRRSWRWQPRGGPRRWGWNCCTRRRACRSTMVPSRRELAR